jgi:hypothetical protein
LITHVETAPGPLADGDATPRIHEALRSKDLLPGQHLTDTGYLDAELLVNSQKEYGVDLVGPTRPDYRWQARAGDGFAASDFQVDWEAQRVTCPEGRLSIGWTEAVDRGHNDVIKVKFSARDCRTCPSREKSAGETADGDPTPAGAVRGAASGAGAGGDGGVSAIVRQVSGDRRHDLARGADLRLEEVALRRGGQDALAARRDRGIHQRHPDQQLAIGKAPRADASFRLCKVDGAGGGVTDLPTVTALRENPFLMPITNSPWRSWASPRFSVLGHHRK